MNGQQIDLELLIRFLGQNQLERFLLLQENENLKKQLILLNPEDKKPAEPKLNYGGTGRAEP